MKLFYRVTQGLKRCYNVAAGNTRMEKRGLRPAEDSQLYLGAHGFSVGLVVAAPLAGIATESWTVYFLTLAASPFVLPVVTHQAYSLYKCGEHDYGMKQIEKREEAKSLPKPKRLILR